ncbi:transposase [Deinococcus yavapaiensis]|uniref:Uncharacterized protein n=1 Tax=Deinococcus yavapaiensis KR-236 TaxID=694435 RepID=A0A318S3N9_9DEIO|nr:transposase [Deinococcus yavapaiensis]PYE52055.1 hypothetical protein DES52_113101 [Deinococcus yavapaiensis KR-236]
MRLQALLVVFGLSAAAGQTAPPPFEVVPSSNYEGTAVGTYDAALTVFNDTPSALQVSARVTGTNEPTQLSFVNGTCPSTKPYNPTFLSSANNVYTRSINRASEICLIIGPLSKKASVTLWTSTPAYVERVPLPPTLASVSPPDNTYKTTRYWVPFIVQETCSSSATTSVVTNANGQSFNICTDRITPTSPGGGLIGAPSVLADTYTGTLANVLNVDGEKVKLNVTVKHFWLFPLLVIYLGLMLASFIEFLRTTKPEADRLEEKASKLRLLEENSLYKLMFNFKEFKSHVKRRLSWLAFGPVPTLDELEAQRVAASQWAAFHDAHQRLHMIDYQTTFIGYQPMFDPAAAPYHPITNPSAIPGVVALLNDLRDEGTTIGAKKPFPATDLADNPIIVHKVEIKPDEFARALSLMRDALTIADLIKELDLQRSNVEVLTAPAARDALVSLERRLYKPPISPNINLSAEDMAAYTRSLIARFDRFIVAYDRAKVDKLLAIAPIGAQTFVPYGIKTAGTTAATGGVTSGRAARVLGDHSGEFGREQRGLALRRSFRGAILFWSALVLALVAGMQALYMNDAPWGTFWDYVVAFTWGSLVYTGLSQLTNALIGLRNVPSARI